MVKSSRNHQRPALLVIVNLLTFVLTVAEGAPSTTTAALPAPPTSDGSGMLNDYPDVDWRRTQTEPTSRTISFLKVSITCIGSAVTINNSLAIDHAFISANLCRLLSATCIKKVTETLNQ